MPLLRSYGCWDDLQLVDSKLTKPSSARLNLVVVKLSSGLVLLFRIQTKQKILMKPDKKTLMLPILLIAVGAGWLLTTLGVVPGIDWVWTLGLAAVGLLTFAVGGLDKVTVVIGPCFILASCLSILRQTDRLRLDVEIPILVIGVGILLLVARSPAVPIPSWISVLPKSNPD